LKKFFLKKESLAKKTSASGPSGRWGRAKNSDRDKKVEKAGKRKKRAR